MYTAVLSLIIGMLLNNFTILRLIIFGYLIIVLLYKISVEEKMLLTKRTDYKE
jgi:protein-S-isoprenylcysteine O-methyltransferase Ste14